MKHTPNTYIEIVSEDRPLYHVFLCKPYVGVKNIELRVKNTLIDHGYVVMYEVSDLSEIKMVEITTPIIGYTDDTTTISVDEFDSLNAEHNDRYGEFFKHDTDFPDLETEFEARKSLQKIRSYSAIHGEDVVTPIDVELVCIGKQIKVSNQNITAPISTSKPSSYCYLDQLAQVRDALIIASKLHDVTIAIPSNPYDIRSDRLSYRGENTTAFLFTLSGVSAERRKKLYDYGIVPISGRYDEFRGIKGFNTVEEAQARADEIAQFVAESLAVAIQRTRPVQELGLDIDELYNELGRIKNKVDSIEPYQKSRTDKNVAMTAINEFMKTLEQLATR